MILHYKKFAIESQLGDMLCVWSKGGHILPLGYLIFKLTILPPSFFTGLVFCLHVSQTDPPLLLFVVKGVI